MLVWADICWLPIRYQLYRNIVQHYCNHYKDDLTELFLTCLLILDALCSHCKVPGPLFDVVFWLGYCNSMLNPLIYAMWSQEFKNTFISIIKCQCHRRSNRPIPTIVKTPDNDPAHTTLRHNGISKPIEQSESTDEIEESLSMVATPSQSHEDVHFHLQQWL